MTLTTAINALPYPELSNVKDQVAQFSAFSAQADSRYVSRYSNTAARDAANPTPVSGQLVYLKQEEYLTGRQGSSWVIESIPFFVRKTVNQSVTSSVTPVKDSQLKFTAKANSSYIVEAIIAYSGLDNGAGTAGINFSWNITNSTSSYKIGLGPTSHTTSSDHTNVVLQTLQQSPTAGAGASTDAPSTISIMRDFVYLTTNSSSAEVNFQFTQLVSNATPVTVYANYSYLKIIKIT